MLTRPDVIRALKARARALVDDLEAKHQPVDPRDVAERALIAHGPIESLSLPERATLIAELEQFVRDLRSNDTHV